MRLFCSRSREWQKTHTGILLLIRRHRRCRRRLAVYCIACHFIALYLRSTVSLLYQNQENMHKELHIPLFSFNFLINRRMKLKKEERKKEKLELK